MLTPLTPAALRPPFANYAHAVEVSAGARLLFLSGQLGIHPDDSIPEGAEEQADLIFANIGVILAEAGMTPANIVRINAYVSAREHMQPYMRARDRFVSGAGPASTLMIVTGFTREIFKVEIEVLAAADPVAP